MYIKEKEGETCSLHEECSEGKKKKSTGVQPGKRRSVVPRKSEEVKSKRRQKGDFTVFQSNQEDLKKVERH
ncbi:hypothetical protein NQZ68_027854 [Dissostichus eleginoides]|nr:hypothetical protein NQZ68_027854 [Dissostichus eleginoides]